MFIRWNMFAVVHCIHCMHTPRKWHKQTDDMSVRVHLLISPHVYHFKHTDAACHPPTWIVFMYFSHATQTAGNADWTADSIFCTVILHKCLNCDNKTYIHHCKCHRSMLNEGRMRDFSATWQLHIILNGLSSNSWLKWFIQGQETFEQMS